jgi:DNA-binding Lrp family transcriptional regulator
VLIETEVGKVAHVAQAIAKLDGVQLAEDLTGPYDVIARLQASSLDQVGRLVASRIQLLDGVTRTMPFMRTRSPESGPWCCAVTRTTTDSPP